MGLQPKEQKRHVGIRNRLEAAFRQQIVYGPNSKFE
jgi:hypothetical protein